MNYIKIIRNIVKKYNLSYTFNPGGAEFNLNDKRCQIFTYNDKEDLKILIKWLKEIKYK